MLMTMVIVTWVSNSLSHETGVLLVLKKLKLKGDMKSRYYQKLVFFFFLYPIDTYLT